MKTVEETLLGIYPLGNEDLQLLASAGEEITFRKGEHLVREGSTDSSFYVIRDGILRAYYSTEEKDITVWFATAGEVCYSSWGYQDNAPARLSIAATCDTAAIRYTKSQTLDLFFRSSELAHWSYFSLLQLLTSTDYWFLYLSDPDASHRYCALMEKYPDILRHVPLKDIAAYLRITPQSLSRIRSRMARKKQE